MIRLKRFLSQNVIYCLFHGVNNLQINKVRAIIESSKSLWRAADGRIASKKDAINVERNAERSAARY
ncbi:hypothetical protein ACJIZ3_012621 [Penstemon smallii]|uniref:Transposase n=1 Tax=Penstemon smallii TaxID=265156 RepID=A0ABD3UMK5_9LAMI